MRILLVNRFFGGKQVPTGRMAEDVAEELIRLGHSVTVLASNGTYIKGGKNPAIEDTETKRRESGLARLTQWAWFWLKAVFGLMFFSWDRCVLLTDPPFLPLAAWLTRPFRSSRRRVYWWTMDIYPEALVAAGMISSGGLPCRSLKVLNELGLSAISGVVVLGARQLARLECYAGWNRSPGFATIVPPWDLRRVVRVENGVNRVLQRHDWAGRNVALYAGNLGEGHLCREFAEAARWFHGAGREDWIFVFVVQGSGRSSLEEMTADLPNVRVLDYLPEAETSDLLWSATVHLISMKRGWEGVIVPSKLYGALQTSAPILFIGPPDADTAAEVLRLARGATLPPGTSGADIAEKLDELAKPSWRRDPVFDSSGPGRIAEIVAR